MSRVPSGWNAGFTIQGKMRYGLHSVLNSTFPVSQDDMTTTVLYTWHRQNVRLWVKVKLAHEDVWGGGGRRLACFPLQAPGSIQSALMNLFPGLPNDLSFSGAADHDLSGRCDGV
jgi:hypothetical protein